MYFVRVRVGGTIVQPLSRNSFRRIGCSGMNVIERNMIPFSHYSIIDSSSTFSLATNECIVSNQC